MSVFSQILVAIVGTLVASLITREASGWAPRIIEGLHALAVRRLPEARRERMAEEWLGALADLPTPFSRLMFASGLIVAAEKIRAREVPILSLALAGYGTLAITSISGTAVRMFKALTNQAAFWLIASVGVAVSGYMATSYAASQRQQLRTVEQQIIKAQQEIRVLERQLNQSYR